MISQSEVNIMIHVHYGARSHRKLAKRAGVHSSTARRLLMKLQDNGLVIWVSGEKGYGYIGLTEYGLEALVTQLYEDGHCRLAEQIAEPKRVFYTSNGNGPTQPVWVEKK